MNNNLFYLAAQILFIEEPINKVRFAKTIYFVHKTLIKKGILSSDYICYIRMPLGPVPIGFMSLSEDFIDIEIKKVSSNLSYNSTEYYLTRKGRRNMSKNIDMREDIREALNHLDNISTSELIEISHMDSSWIENNNGHKYCISQQDMKNEVPKKKSPMRLKSDEQLIQASLVKGMLEDIISESTDLEYPTDERH